MGSRPDNRPRISPFTVLIDSGEQHPYTFDGICSYSAQNYRPIIIRKRTEHLGPAQGDYQIAEYRGLFAIERKSVEDLYGTILGWSARRERFLNELAELERKEGSAIIVEGSLGTVLASARQWGEKTADQNRKTLYGSYLSWSQRFNVPWIFCDTRRLAEITAYRLMEKFYDHKRKEERQRKKEAAQAAAANHPPMSQEVQHGLEF